jgi:hypothetical protein
VIPVLLQQLELERVGDRIRRNPGLGLGFEAPDDQAADLLLEVGVAVRVAQHRQVGVDALERLGDDVEVLRRVQRHGHPGHRADLLGPLAGAVDHDLRLDVPVVGADAGHPTSPDDDAGHPDPLDDPRAPLPGTPGQGLGGVGRVGLAVPW